MRGGNEGSSIFKPEDWIGYAYLIVFILVVVNMFTMLVWDVDYWAMAGVVISAKYPMVMFLLLAAFCFVHLKQEANDRPWNFGLLIAFVVVIAGGNVGVSVDASKATDNLAQAASQAKARADTGVQHVQQNVAPRQTAAAPQQKVDNNSYYNPYRRNTNSGSNYSRCAQLLKNNDLGNYQAQKCNTGAPLPSSNIATCRKWEANGGMTDYQAQGCGVKRPTWRGTWCALNVGQPGQNRQAFCK